MPCWVGLMLGVAAAGAGGNVADGGGGGKVLIPACTGVVFEGGNASVREFRVWPF